MAQLVKNLPAMQKTWFDPWVGKTRWRRERLPTPVLCPGEFHGCVVHGVAKRHDLSDFHFTFSLFLSIVPFITWKPKKRIISSFIQNLFQVTNNACFGQI